MLLRGTKEQISITVNVQAKSDNGRTIKDKVILQVKRPTRTETINYRERMSAMDDVEICRDWIVGWELKDANGEPIEFTQDNFDEVMEHKDYYLAIRKEVFMHCIDVDVDDVLKMLNAATAKN